MTRALAVPVVILIVATGCATRDAVTPLRSDLAQLHAELADARAAHESAVWDIARINAELQTLDARTRELASRIHQTADEVARLGKRLEAAEEAVRTTRARIEALPTPPAAPPVERPPGEPPAGGPEQTYAAALATFRAREHGRAILAFLDFRERYPRHRLAGNAQYWIGESYYAQRDYGQALLEFQKVFEIGTAKRPDALVKIGLCYLNLHDPARAQQVWQRVVREYPHAESATLAQTLLRTHAAARR